MILRKFSCTVLEYRDPYYWRLHPVDLEKINLFVAKNATGKTKTVNAIFSLGKLISGTDVFIPIDYIAEFFDGSSVYQYELNVDRNMEISEKLTINGVTRIEREKTGKGKIYAEQLDENILFQLPSDNLAVLKRDIIQHPYLEPLFDWANTVYYYAFGSSMNQQYKSKIKTPNVRVDDTADDAVQVFIQGKREYKDRYKADVLSSMNEIGYNLLDVDFAEGIDANKSPEFEYNTLYVIESDRFGPLLQTYMSQGMFRALSIIIHLTYHKLMNTPVTFIIDDIGEGLDFDRSSKLIKLLIELAEQNDNIQLIMSTNDRFVMNAVPLQYWQVIQREGGECRVFNYQNSKEKFDEFEYMGLNNFDFLATDYLNSKWEKI